DRVVVRELGIEYDVDVRQGQKTGLFLDQRENRAAAAGYARGRLLDCFSYNGGFAVTLARRCEQVVALGLSEAAVARLRTSAAPVHVTVVEKRMQGRDHPVLLGAPETYYLKCFMLRKLA